MGKRILGIVCSRAGSTRLKAKNRKKIHGIPLALRAVSVLKEHIDYVVHLTDIEQWWGEEDTFPRPEYLNSGDVPVQKVVRWFLFEYIEDKKDYDTVVMLFPTNPFITSHDIEKAINLYINGDFKIIRSYNSLTGEENGLYIYDIDYFLSNDYRYDVFTGAIILPGTEIHTEMDYRKAKEALEDVDNADS